MRFSVVATLVALSAATSGYAKVHLAKSGGNATVYTPGLGSCGHKNVDTDYVTAIDHATMKSFPGAHTNSNSTVNPLCGRKIRVTYGGRSILVKVADTCLSCADGSIDLSPSAFKEFASVNIGQVRGIKWTLV